MENKLLVEVVKNLFRRVSNCKSLGVSVSSAELLGHLSGRSWLLVLLFLRSTVSSVASIINKSGVVEAVELKRRFLLLQSLFGLIWRVSASAVGFTASLSPSIAEQPSTHSFITSELPPRYWVRSEQGRLVQISTVGCDKVGEFINVIRTKVRLTQLGLPKDHGPLTLRITETGKALRDDLALAEIQISQQPGFRENSGQMPLLLVVESKKRSECSRLERLVPDLPAVQSLFEVPAAYLPMSDVALDGGLLFCRPLFWKQFTFLDEVLHTKRRDAQPSHNPYSVGWILGAPGTGKSTSTLAFLSTIDQGFWAITWLAIGDERGNYIQIVAGQIRTGTFSLRSGVGECLSMVDDDLHHVLFVDGYASGVPLFEEVRICCQDWLWERFENRRLVFICLMTAIFKVRRSLRVSLGITEFVNELWTKEEYLSALQHEGLYERIKVNFDSTACRNNTLKDEISSKYYFAGGSVRYMFATKTSKVIADISHAVAEVQDIIVYTRLTIGECSESVINCLISCYGNGGNDTVSQRKEIVSQFAASKLATGLEKSEIRRASRALGVYLNPAIGGWFVEIWFFATLKRTGRL
ncbi:unnamed protein product [Calypogeia fissa]